MNVAGWRLPVGGLAVAGLCIVFAFAGLMSHDPWKTADAVHLSIARGFAMPTANSAAGLLIPHMAGNAWLETPPLYHWIAALIGNVAAALAGPDFWISGARSTSALFSLGGLLGIHAAARGFHGREAGLVAPLLAMGTLGLFVPAHDAQPATTAFAAVGAVLAGLAWWELRPRTSALALGGGIGIGMLGVGPGMAVATAIVVGLALCYPRWRRVSASSWIVVAGLSACLVAAWPVALHLVAPDAFETWWSIQSGPSERQMFDAKRMQILAWGTWPALPIALWTIWLQRARLLSGRNAVPLAAVLASGAYFLLNDEPIEAILPLIAALSVVGSAGAGKLRRGAANALDWFGTMTITMFMALVWIAAIAIQTGEPARIAKNFTKPAPGFVAEFAWPVMTTAILVTLVWLTIVFAFPRSPWRAVARWGIGITATWVLVVALVLPWADYSKTYRPVSAQLKAALGTDPGCITSQSVGMGQLGAFDVLHGIQTTPRASGSTCAWLLRQTMPGLSIPVPGWDVVTIAARPGDRSEVYVLYRRTPYSKAR